MPRLKAPADAGAGVFVGGGYFPVDAEGCIEVTDGGDYSMLTPLGYTPVGAPAAVEPQPEIKAD